MLLVLLFSLLLSAAPPLGSQVSYERGATQLEDILPASPEASVRVKYADVPFTHSLGAVQYSVPLWELKGRELTIPISLEYCSNGIKMDEIAGVAGLGWTLNAGGCITREVVYMPDEFKDGSFSYIRPSNSLLSSLLDRVNNTSTNTFLHNVLWNRVDVNADLYKYDVCGLKGSFIVTPSLEVIQLQGPGVVIQSPDSLRTMFKIIGPDGTVYEFGERETGTRQGQYVENSTIFSGHQANWTATTTWYLTKIESRDGTESAHFEYVDGDDWDRTYSTITRALTESPSYNTSGFDESMSVGTSSVETSHAVKALSSITLSGYTATFQYDDVSSRSGHAVSSGYDSWNFPLRLTDVTVTSCTGRQLLHASVSTSRHGYDGRILLNGINVYHGNVLADRWTFAYNTLDQTVARVSQDWFGYYNGETSRLDLCPYVFTPGLSYSLTLSHGAPDASCVGYMLLNSADHDGARTEWECEPAPSGQTIWMNGQNIGIDVGVRVKKIRTYDGSTLKRVRTFTYSNPKTTTSVLPLEEVYLRTTAHKVNSGGGYISPTKTRWEFTLHETPVTDGQNLQSARVWYGSVTEDVSPSGTSLGHKTVYTYSTAPVYNSTYNTRDRFPSTWEDDYEQDPVGIQPFAGIQSAYVLDGASEPSLLTQKDTHKGTPDSGASTLVEKEKISYKSFGTDYVLAGYKVVQVMHRLYSFTPYEQDLQHYPIYCQLSRSSAPISQTTYEYLPSGTDTTSYSFALLPRDGVAIPIRRSATELSSGDALRSVKYYYPDTWSSADTSSWLDAHPFWLDSLVCHHALSIPVRQNHIVVSKKIMRDDVPVIPLPFFRRIPDIIPAFYVSDTTTVVTEYSNFSGLLMPSAKVEYRNGVESWREEILDRNALGNPTRIRVKGQPETTVLWSYKGLYPVAVVQNVPYSSVISAMRGAYRVGQLADRPEPTLIDSLDLEYLRQGIGNHPLPDSARVTTFRFIPGVGVSFSSDPGGRATTWTYDAAGRLASTANTLGQTVGAYSYQLLNDGANRLRATEYTFRDASGASSSAKTLWWNTLGQKIEEVGHSASGDLQHDLVSAFEGDYMLNDDVRVWQPYPVPAASPGTFRSGAAAASATYHGSPEAYTGTGYEHSARNLRETGSLPGYASYKDSLKRDSFSGFPILVWHGDSVRVCGTYGAGHLEVERRRDADGRWSISVRDHAGRQVGTARGEPVSAGQMTRYVYDKGDRLSAVIGAGISVKDTLAMWRYGYDSLGRLASKGIPGAAREFYTYDSGDRLVELRRADGLEEYEYDAFNRIVKKWFTPTGGNRSLTEEHSYDTHPGAALSLLGGSSHAGSNAKGLETYSRMAVVGTAPSGGPQYAETAVAYDALGRIERSVTSYPDGQINDTRIVYDFSGSPLLTTVKGTRPGSPSVVDSLCTATAYDIWERPVRIENKLFSSGVMVASDTTVISYDALGRRSATTTGPLTGQLTYALQGWLKTIGWTAGTSLSFSETLKYEDAASGSALAVPTHTGLISAKDESWTAGLQSGSLHEEYAYDAAARLSAWDDGSSEGENFAYDLRSNILSVTGRHPVGGVTPVETYTYSADKLATYTPSTGGAQSVSFVHDALGRMTSDGLSGLSITYNRLDLPENISRLDTLKAHIEYLPDGAKLSSTDANGAGLLYRGPFVYRVGMGGANRALESVPFEGGVLTASGTLYHLTDHLGNVRAVVDKVGNVYSLNDYGVYGRLKSSPISVPGGLAPAPTGVSLRHTLTGKENLTPDFFVPFTDFGARHYRPSLRRWIVPDKLSEKYYDFSPYAYCGANPVNIVDEDGNTILIDDLEYKHGRIYDSEGDEIPLEQLSLFCKKAMNAIIAIESAEIGLKLVNALSDSDYVYTITESSISSFTPNNARGAYALQYRKLFPQYYSSLTIGSGGHIAWNPSGEILSTTGFPNKSSTIDLAHELFHGLDAMHGLLNKECEDSLYKDEYQSVYNENILRYQLFYPLRTHYFNAVDKDGNYLGGFGPSMLVNGMPFCPPWYNSPL